MGVVNFFRVGSPALVVWPESGCYQRTQAVQTGLKSYTGSNTNIIWKTHQRGSWPNNRILYNSSWSSIPSGCWRPFGTQSISSKFITRRKLFLSMEIFLFPSWLTGLWDVPQAHMITFISELSACSAIQWYDDKIRIEIWLWPLPTNPSSRPESS